MRTLWLGFLCVALAGCGSNDSNADAASGGTAGSGGAAGAAGSGGSAGSAGAGGSAGAAPVLDPALFDCTFSGIPDRVSPIPITCATDNTCTEKLVSGHRGAGGSIGVIAPEDTVSAVKAAIALGVDYVETDPRPTLDGKLVNLHDTTVDRTTDGSGEASQMTLAEIQALHIDAAKFPGDFSCERVPTLEQILTTARGKVHVLVDANKTDRVDLLVQAIQTTDTLEWAIFDTDSVAKIQEALALEPKLLIMVRISDQAELDSALQTFAGHPPVLVELHDGASPKLLAGPVHAAGHRVMTNTFGTDVAAGFGDNPELYAEPYDNGVDVVQTDRPDLVLRYLGR